MRRAWCLLGMKQVGRAVACSEARVEVAVVAPCGQPGKAAASHGSSPATWRQERINKSILLFHKTFRAIKWLEACAPNTNLGYTIMALIY